MGDDILRFMNENKITMATIGGHGFGAKVATATANANLNRFTGVICLDGGPIDHRWHECYQELAEYISFAKKLNLSKLDANGAFKELENGISCPKWRSIFKQNLETEKGDLSWKNNMNALYKNTQKY